jgi:hypothetical protein
MLGFLKKLFTKAEEPPAQRISMAPVQSQDEQDATRGRMQAEMDASRAKRNAKESGEDGRD